MDISSYFAPCVSDRLEFYLPTPCRVADTRLSTSPAGLGTPTMAGATSRSFPVAATPLPRAGSAGAYSFNFTAVPQATKLGIFTTWPNRKSPVANAAIVPPGISGAISIG